MSRIIVNKTTIVIKCSIAADAKKEKQTWEQNKWIQNEILQNDIG